MAHRETSYDEPARGAGLAGALEILRRRRALALIPFLFVLTAAAALAFFLPSLWTARALILVNRQQIPETFVRPTVTTDLEARLLTLSHDILSRPRLQQIVQEYRLYPHLRRTHSPEAIVDRMRKDIRLELRGEDERDRRRDQRSIAFAVAYTTTDPRLSVLVTNTLAALYSQENTKLREQQAVGASEFLEAQLRDVRQRLVEQERRIAQYKERHLGELPEQREANLRTLERLQQQLQLAHENNRRANERKQLITQSLAEIDQGSGLASAGASGPNVTPADTTAARLTLLRQELAEMRSKYSEKYPDVIALRQQIGLLEARVAADGAAALPRGSAPAPRRDGKEVRVAPQNPYIQSLMQQLDQATIDGRTTAAEITTLSAQIGTYQRRIENTPKREQELALITRDHETTREQFRSLLAKRGEADMAADLEQRQKGEQFRVIEPAALPERPTGPNRLRLLLVGLALALGASGLAVVLAEQVDTSFRRVDDVRAALPVPVLSAIPRITTERDRLRGLRQRRLATAAIGVGLLVVAGSSFVVAHNNQSLVTMLTATEPAKR
jgi:polysaccharide chain length determinant protein (PEP-CTERM system associated)